MAEDQQKRQTARKLWIRDLLNGTYIKEEGTKPNYVLLQDHSKVSRVNLVGAVVAITAEGLPQLTLDDGTGKITARAFEPMQQISAIKIGDAVLLIGRPRAFGREMYVLPEVIKTLPGTKWLDVRKLELSAHPAAAQEKTKTPEPVIEETLDDSFQLSEKVIDTIRSLDSGSGAETEAIIAKAGSEAERTIAFLLRNGDIFEASPGRLKVLE